MAFEGEHARPEFRTRFEEKDGVLVEAQQTPEERAAAERRRRAAAAAAAGGTLVVVGDTVAPVADVPPAAARATAAGAILSGVVAFLAAQRARMRVWLREQMRRRAPAASPDDIERLIAEEERRQQAFEEKQAARFARDITAALAIPDAAQREGAIRGITAREERYARQRDEAMAARAFAAVDRVVLRQQSPLGAFWKSDPTVIEHTAGCLLMSGGGGGRGKFWPWAVLDHVHPPRHPGCPCKLHGYGEAVASGWMSPGDVPDVRTAIRRAAGVVMEGALLVDPEAADALIEAAGGRELMEMRTALLEAGLVADEGALDELLTEYDPDQPRWPKGHPRAGQWRPKLGAGVGPRGGKPSPARRVKDFDDLRRLVNDRPMIGTTPAAGTKSGPVELKAGQDVVVGGEWAKVVDPTPAPTATDERREGSILVRDAQGDRWVVPSAIGVPVYARPEQMRPEHLEAVGAGVAELAERYGTWTADRARIDALNEERKALVAGHTAKIEAEHPGGSLSLYSAERRAAEAEGRKADYAKVRERIDSFWTDAERARMKDIDAEVARLLKQERRGRRDAMLAVLSELRPMGGRHRVSSIRIADDSAEASPELREKMERTLREAERFVPRAWIEDTNAKADLKLRHAGGRRAFHRLMEEKSPLAQRIYDETLSAEFVGWLPDGRFVTKNIYGAVQAYTVERDAPGDREMLRVDGSTDIPGLKVEPAPVEEARKTSLIVTDYDDPSTMLHELMHRHEQVVGEEGIDGNVPLLRHTLRFLRQRAGDEELKYLKDIWPGSGYENHERAWEDKFVDAYVGKDYGQRATEVLTMGVQMLFFPEAGSRDLHPRPNGAGDAGMRDFILGLLATQ